MKNWEVALSGTSMRAIAMVPVRFSRPALPACSASLGMGEWVGFSIMSSVSPPPWIMKPGITRWKIVPA